MPTRRFLVPVAALGLAAATALGGCAAIDTARMALPGELEGREAVPIEGIGGGERGEFRVGAQRGRFERGAQRLELFERLGLDRGHLRHTLVEPSGAELQADCRLRANTGSLGVLNVPLKPVGLVCSYRRGGQALAQRLELAAVDRAAGTRDERRGRFESDGIVLELQSVHRVQGSPLPLAAPVGYLLLQQGRPVGAVELTDATPRLWRPAPGALADAVTQAALALALAWDPARLAP